MAILAIIILLVLVPMVLGIVIHYGLPRRDVEELPGLRFYRAFAPLGDFAAMTLAVMVFWPDPRDFFEVLRTSTAPRGAFRARRS